MGEILDFKCTDRSCGWELREVHFGAGMEILGSELYLCYPCHRVTSFEGGPYPWNLKPGEEASVIDGLCSNCGKPGEHWPSAHDDDIPMLAVCPKCLEKTVEAENAGIWD